MALDPTRRTGSSPDGVPAASVSVLWVQQRLNALLAGSAPALALDGTWGANTRGAIGQFVVSTLGATAAGMLGGEWYSVLNVDPATGRMLLTLPLERALAGTSSTDAGPPTPAAAGGAGFAIGLAVLASMGLYFATRSRAGGVRGLGADPSTRPWRVRDKLTRARYHFDTQAEAKAFVDDVSASEITGEPLLRWAGRLTVERNTPSRGGGLGSGWLVHEGRPSWHQARAGHGSAASTSGFSSREEAEAWLRRAKENNPSGWRDAWVGPDPRAKGGMRGLGGKKLSSEQRRTMEVTNSIAAARHGLKEKDWPSVEYAIHRLRALKSPSAEQYQAQYDAALRK